MKLKVSNVDPETKEDREQSTVIISKLPRTLILVCINDLSMTVATQEQLLMWNSHVILQLQLQTLSVHLSRSINHLVVQ